MIECARSACRAAIVILFVTQPRRNNVAKRPRFSRWRRLPGVFRTGDHRPDASGTELDRIILYVPARILDLAEALAEKAGVASIQDYCGLLLMQAIENERVRQKIAGFESQARAARRIERDRRRSRLSRRVAEAVGREGRGRRRAAAAADAPIFIDDPTRSRGVSIPSRRPLRPIDSAAEPVRSRAAEPAPEHEPIQVRVVPASDLVPPDVLMPMVQLMNDRSAAEILASHVGMDEDEWGFLPCLRRGEAVPAAKVAELEAALERLEQELRGSESLDRRIAHSLYRLALESQVLLTDAWPGVFDDRVIQAIRTVQEAVERILSDQDIRFYPPEQTGVGATELTAPAAWPGTRGGLHSVTAAWPTRSFSPATRRPSARRFASRLRSAGRSIRKAERPRSTTAARPGGPASRSARPRSAG